MSKEYYLIPKELIDSRIEELESKLNKWESWYKDSEFGKLAEDNANIGVTKIELKTLQSLTQQNELVEIEEITTWDDILNPVEFGRGSFQRDEYKSRLLTWLKEHYNVPIKK